MSKAGLEYLVKPHTKYCAHYHKEKLALKNAKKVTADVTSSQGANVYSLRGNLSTLLGCSSTSELHTHYDCQLQPADVDVHLTGAEEGDGGVLLKHGSAPHVDVSSM